MLPLPMAVRTINLFYIQRSSIKMEMSFFLTNSKKKRIMKASTAFLYRCHEGRYCQRNWKISKTFFIYGCRRKTGTTSNSYDYWFSGYTPYHTASVWMGYDKNTNFASDNTHKKYGQRL